MAWKNIDERRETIGKVLSAGIEIGSREAKVLSVLYSCSPSAILADAKVVKAPQHGREIRPQAGPGDAEGVRPPPVPGDRPPGAPCGRPGARPGGTG